MSQSNESTKRTAQDEQPAPKLNLGCGHDHRPDYHNVDIRETVNPDQTVNLDEHPWPWPDNQFSEVLAHNILEHLDDQPTALDELHRVTKPGGIIKASFPHPNSPGQWIDPTHQKPLMPETFTHEVAPPFELVEVSCSRVRFGRVLPESWALWWALHLGFLVDEIQVEVRVCE